LPAHIGYCGALVPPADRRALAQAFIGLLSDATARERLARCGQKRFHARYELSTLQRELADRYRLAVSGR